MATPIDVSTFRIFHHNGTIVGTGFLVAKNLAVTCAHVILDADAFNGDTIQVQFTNRVEKINAYVIPEFWLDIANGDIAFLRLESMPEGIPPLRLGLAGSCHPGSEFRSFGYATAANVQGIYANGKIDGYLSQHMLLQLQSPQANHGISGAPVLDEKQGVILGMITKGHIELGRNELTTFATPTELLWKICPIIKPPIPILPRRNPIVEGINLLLYDYDQRIQNFLTEYLGSDASPVPFGGRDEALSLLDGWLAETTPYLLLAAPAGRGKSALLVRWLDSLIAREDLALAFVPISIRFGTNMERAFYAALAARLAFLHGDDIPASPETSTAVYRGLVNDYLTKPLKKGRVLLVVLDGLDEAADWQSGADFMPSELPAGVRVVVSARFLAGDSDSIPWLHRLNWERKGLAAAPSLVPLDQAGVADVLLKMGCPLDKLSHDVDIVTELYRLSEGDPLLVGLYVGDLWAKGEAVARLKPKDLAGIQPGYKGYFDRWWGDQKKLWGKDKPWLEKHVRSVRKLLAGALGPLFLPDIHALAPKLESDYIADALDILQRFVIGDNKTRGYTLSHPKLGQYFWEALTPTEQTQIENHFLTWGESIIDALIHEKLKPANTPHYLLQYYGTHLERGHAIVEKFLPFITYPYWHQAWIAYEGANGGYLQYVIQTWNICRKDDQEKIKNGEKPLYLSAQIKCALIKSSFHSLALNIKFEWLPHLVQNGNWTLSQALLYIRQVADSEKKANSIKKLIPLLEEYEFSRIVSSIREISDEVARADIMRVLIENLPEEKIIDVLDITCEIHNIDAFNLVFNTIVDHISEGQLVNILLAARGIADESQRSVALSILIKKIPKTYLADLVTMALEIKSEGARTRVLISLAQNIPDWLLENILAAARSIKSEGLRAKILSEIIRNAPKKLLGKVLLAIREIQNDGYRASAFACLLDKLPEVKEETLASARAVDNDAYRAYTLSMIAHKLPDVWDEALSAAQAIKNEWDRVKSLISLVEVIPEGKLKDLLSTIQTLKNKRYLFEVLGKLVERLQEAQLTDVFVVIQGIPAKAGRANFLRTLAITLPQEKLSYVRNTVRKSSSKLEQASVLSALTMRLPDLSNEALIAAQRIRDGSDLVQVLIILINNLPDNQLDSILAMSLRLSNEVERAKVLSLLAEKIPVEQLENLLIETEKIKSESARVKVMIPLFKRLPKNLLDKYLVTALKIGDDFERARLVITLAPRLPTLFKEALSISQKIINNEEQAQILSILAQELPENYHEEMLSAISRISDVSKRARVFSLLAEKSPEIWGEVLATAQTIGDEGAQVRACISLAKKLPGLWQEVLHSVRDIRDDLERVRILSALASDQISDEVLREVLAITSAIESEWQRAKILSALAENSLEKQLDKVFIVAQEIEADLERARVLSVLAGKLPMAWKASLIASSKIYNEGTRAQILISLAKNQQHEQIVEVLTAAKEIRSESARTKLLSALAQFAPATSLSDVLASVSELRNWTKHAYVLSILAGRLPILRNDALIATRNIAEDRERADVLIVLARHWPKVRGETLVATRKISKENLRAEALAMLVDVLPKRQLNAILDSARKLEDKGARAMVLCALVKKQPKLRHEALATIRAINDEYIRANALRKLVGNLPEDHMDDVIAVAKEIKNATPRATSLSILAGKSPEIWRDAFITAQRIPIEWERVNVFNELVSNMNCPIFDHSYLLLLDALPLLSERSRHNFLSDLSALMNFVLLLGEDELPREIYETVREVTTWWP